MVSFLLFCSTLGQSTPPAPAPYTGPKLRAAVSGFDLMVKEIMVQATTPSGLPSKAAIELDSPVEFGEGMADQLVTVLSGTQRFVLLERRNLKDVTDELILQKGPEVDADSTVQAGKLLGAQILFRGAVTEISYRKTQNVGGGLINDVGIDAGTATFSALVGIDLKMIDVQTGQILTSVKGEAEVTNKNRFIGFTAGNAGFGHAQFDNSAIAKALRAAIKDAVNKIASGLEKVEWEARVVTASEDDASVIYLNFGAESGLKAGQSLKVFRPGKILVDPQTKLVLGRVEDKPLGTCRITEVTAKFAVAKLDEPFEVKPGDGVKLAGSASKL